MRRYCRKKGFRKGQMGQVAALILIIAGAIIIFMFISRFNNKATYEEVINTCRFSVTAQIATEKIPSLGSMKSPLDLNCEKRYIQFYNTRIELGLNPENTRPMTSMYNGQKISKFKTLTPYIVNQVVAEEMRICWFQFGEGKIPVFANDDKSFWWNDDVCFVCSEINFENTVETTQFTGLIDYMKTTTFDDTGTTYYEYINQATLSERSWEEYNQLDKHAAMLYTPFIMEKGKQYVVVFYKDYDSLLQGKNAYYVEVLSQDKLNTLCEVQAS
jgi:hypothetical protein